MHLWWSLCTLYLHACQVTVTIGSRLRSLLLYLCYVFQALINYLVCWFCMSTLGLLLFQIYFLPAANNVTSVSNQKLDFDFLSPAKGGESQSQKTRTKTQQNSTNSSCCDSDNITVPWAWLVYISTWVLSTLQIRASSGAVWKSRWPSWAPVPNKPTVSVDVMHTQPTTDLVTIIANYFLIPHMITNKLQPNNLAQASCSITCHWQSIKIL